MRVVHIASFPPPIGGVSYFLKRLKEYTDSQEYRDRFEYVDVSGLDSEKKRDEGIICKNKIGIFIFLLKQEPSIVVFHSNSAAHLMTNILFAKKHKFIYFTHGESIIREKNRKGWRNYILNKAEGFVTPTEQLYTKVFLMFGGKCNVKYIPFIIYPNIVAPLKDAQIEDLKRRTDFVFSVYANSLITYNNQDLYGIDMVIDLADRLRKKRMKVGFIILVTAISDTDKYINYVKSIEEKGLNKNFIIINGRIKEASSLYISTDAYLRPTNTDGDSFSIWEALHFGIPVLASDATQRPRGCILFKNRDIESMTKKAVELINNYKFIKKKVGDLKIKGNEVEITEYLLEVSRG